MEKTIVVNLIGGPCSEKSMIASGLFYAIKKLGINAELALEFAKDKVWEESFRTMDDQIYIFAKQYHKIWRLYGKVNVIITDSPLPISLYYMKEPSDYFDKLVIEQYNRFDNLMYFIERGKDYQQEGRIQTKEESIKIDNEIKKLMSKNDINFKTVPQENAVEIITNEILTKLNKNE